MLTIQLFSYSNIRLHISTVPSHTAKFWKFFKVMINLFKWTRNRHYGFHKNYPSISYKIVARNIEKLSKIFCLKFHFLIYNFLNGFLNIARSYARWKQLTISCLMLKNDQTHFKNLAMFTPHDFQSMFQHNA